MNDQTNSDQAPVVSLAPADVVELQDQLLEAATDLDRLSLLLEDAARQLVERFMKANALLDQDKSGKVEEALRKELASAVTAMQFQDMAAQMLTHTVDRVRAVADVLGNKLMGDESLTEPQLVKRHCPVDQRRVDAGSIELF